MIEFHEFCMQLRGYRFFKNGNEVFKYELYAKRMTKEDIFEQFKIVERL